MLSDAEIKEIEEHSKHQVYVVHKDHFIKLLATVKELRELLRKANEYIQCFPSCTESAHPCSCGADQLQKQIEEKIK